LFGALPLGFYIQTLDGTPFYLLSSPTFSFSDPLWIFVAYRTGCKLRLPSSGTLPPPLLVALFPLCSAPRSQDDHLSGNFPTPFPFFFARMVLPWEALESFTGERPFSSFPFDHIDPLPFLRSQRRNSLPAGFTPLFILATRGFSRILSFIVRVPPFRDRPPPPESYFPELCTSAAFSFLKVDVRQPAFFGP